MSRPGAQRSPPLDQHTTPSPRPPNQPSSSDNSPAVAARGLVRTAVEQPRHAVRQASTTSPPPTSPTMLQQPTPPPTGPSSAPRPLDGRVIMPRNPSIDSTVSSSSSLSALPRSNGTSAYRVSQDTSTPADAAALIAAAGSPEAAIQKLITEKNQAASHNSQLWRLVEKQRSMILGLNKDLEKSLKEKERYRKKLKDQLSQSQSELSTVLESTPLKGQGVREESHSPTIASETPTPPSLMSIRDALADDRRVSDSSAMALSDAGPSDASREPSGTHAPFSSAPTDHTPDDRASTRGMKQSEASATSSDSKRSVPPPISIAASQTYGSARNQHFGSPASTAPGFSSPKSATRKAPPAPLQLASPSRVESASVTNNIIDPSDSEYEDDPGSARAEQMGRGRRKTREDDDRQREVLARQEAEVRSRSAKDKQGKSKSKTPVEAPEPDARSLETETPETKPLQRPVEQVARVPAYQHMDDPASLLRSRARSDVAAGMLPKSATAPSLLSPGLPMSPRPGDRPINSPMPRAPINAMPMSPMAGAKSFPLSPRAPRQPIPLPPQTPLSFASPHLARAEGYQVSQPQPPAAAAAATTSHHRSSPSLSAEQQERSSTSSDPTTLLTPGDIYRGFMTEQYPSLLLPPNALPLVYVKTASSRMKPSRQSYIAPRPGDENPVFTLAVHDRSEHKQLWRTEKTYAALATLDGQVKGICSFRERLPDKALFTGHAPAKIDARRNALDLYVSKMMDAIGDEKSALVVCKFLSADAFGAVESDNYFPASTDPRADTPVTKQRLYLEGYLTKRGKNFGGWKARYFVLDGPVLKYFDDRGGAQQGAIKLQNAQIGKQSNKDQNPQEDEDNQFRHAFLIMEPKKKDSASHVRHVLCAESDEERDSWVEALLQYVDFKDEDAENQARGGGVQMSRASDIATANGPRSPRLQKSLNDLRPPSSSTNKSKDPVPSPSGNLRAVGYEDTVAGDAPIIGNSPVAGKPDTPSPTHDLQQPQSPQGVNASMISGPTNLQAIPNDWGMKPPPTPHGKDKKRGGIFSGFRGRSSSDLNDKTSSPGLTPQQEQRPSGSVRAVFGIALAEAVEVSRPFDAVTELPAVVYRCIEFLRANNAAAEEGIFRLSGSTNVIRGLRDRFNTEGDVNLVVDAGDLDVHAVAGLLKGYLRELPSSILTRELHLEFLQCLEMPPHAKIVALNRLVNRLPTANYALLQSLSSFLQTIVNNAEINRMNIRNVGIVFAPTLNVPAPLITAFVEEQPIIFGPPINSSSTSSNSTPVPSNNNNNSTTSTSPHETTPTDLRSPRKQMFSDLPTPAYNQTSFPASSSMPSLYDRSTRQASPPENDTGMMPVHPSYASYQPRVLVAPHGDGGGAYSSLNEAVRVAPAVYTPSGGASASVAGTSRELKSKRRESGVVGAGVGAGAGAGAGGSLAAALAGANGLAGAKKSSMGSLREVANEEAKSF